MCLVMYCLVPERKYYVSIDLIWGAVTSIRICWEVCQISGHHVAAAAGEVVFYAPPVTINACHSSGFIKSCSYHEKCSAATQLFPSCPQGVFFSRPLCKASTNQPQRWPRRSVLCFYLSRVHPCSLQLNTPQPRKGLSSAFQFRGNIELLLKHWLLWFLVPICPCIALTLCLQNELYLVLW